MSKEKRKISSFKKFTDLQNTKNSDTDADGGKMKNMPRTDKDIPMNPNLSSKSKKIEKPMSRKDIIPKDQDINLPGNEDGNQKKSKTKKLENKDKKNESNDVRLYGKVAKFPKNVKASNAYNFLENIQVSKKDIWYIMVEKQDSELQMVKYNQKQGVDLCEFVNGLKNYYINRYQGDDKIIEKINNIKIDGSDKFSIIKNIPQIEIDEKKLVTKITEDLLKLLLK